MVCYFRLFADGVIVQAGDFDDVVDEGACYSASYPCVLHDMVVRRTQAHSLMQAHANSQVRKYDFRVRRHNLQMSATEQFRYLLYRGVSRKNSCREGNSEIDAHRHRKIVMEIVAKRAYFSSPMAYLVGNE